MASKVQKKVIQNLTDHYFFYSIFSDWVWLVYKSQFILTIDIAATNPQWHVPELLNLNTFLSQKDKAKQL